MHDRQSNGDSNKVMFERTSSGDGSKPRARYRRHAPLEIETPASDPSKLPPKKDSEEDQKANIQANREQYLSDLERERDKVSRDLYKLRIYKHADKIDDDSDEPTGCDGEKGIPILIEPSDSIPGHEFRVRALILKFAEHVERLLAINEIKKLATGYIENQHDETKEQLNVRYMKQAIHANAKKILAKYVDDDMAEQSTARASTGSTRSRNHSTASQCIASEHSQSLTRGSTPNSAATTSSDEKEPEPHTPSVKALKPSGHQSNPSVSISASSVADGDLFAHSTPRSMIPHSQSNSHLHTLAEGDEKAQADFLPADLKKLLRTVFKSNAELSLSVFTKRPISAKMSVIHDYKPHNLITFVIRIISDNLDVRLPKDYDYAVSPLRETILFAHDLDRRIRALNDYLVSYQAIDFNRHCLRQNLLKQSINHAIDMSTELAALLKNYNDAIKEYFEIKKAMSIEMEKMKPNGEGREKRDKLQKIIRQMEVTDTPLNKLDAAFHQLCVAYVNKLNALKTIRRGCMFFGESLTTKAQDKRHAQKANKAQLKLDSIDKFIQTLEDNIKKDAPVHEDNDSACLPQVVTEKPKAMRLG